MSILKDRPQWPDGRVLPGETLYDDRFDKSLGLWRDHMGNTVQHAPLSRTALRTWEGSGGAMQLSTSTRPNTPPVQMGSCQAWRNDSQNFLPGILRLECWAALGMPLQNAADVDNTVASFFIAFDIQSSDDTHRAFPKLQFNYRTHPGSSGLQTRAWSVPTDSNQRVYLEAGDPDGPGTPTTTDTAGATVKPTKPPVSPGDNEFKLNVFRFALWFDQTTTVVNATTNPENAPGRYYRADIGAQVYDLRNLVDVQGNPVGRSSEPPQLTSPHGGGPFTAGFNSAVAMQNRADLTLPYPPVMIVPRVRCTWWPQAALPTLDAQMAADIAAATEAGIYA